MKVFSIAVVPLKFTARTVFLLTHKTPIKQTWFVATSLLSLYTYKVNLTGRLATEMANYSAETGPPFHHSLSKRTNIHQGVALSGAPRFHLSRSLKGIHTSGERLQRHSPTSHSRTQKSRVIRVRAWGCRRSDSATTTSAATSLIGS